MRKLTPAFLAAALAIACAPLQAQNLKGSRNSMERQHQAALNYGYSFMQTSKAIADFVEQGHLVKVERDRYTDLHDVSYPYARPAVKTFINRLSAQYFDACREKMTVTSLTRPINRQPSNASADSVHPTGMAVDLRIPPKGSCRTWLESTLLDLEKTGVLDVTRERNPPHYHVAVFTQTYEQYVAGLDNAPPAATAVPAVATTTVASASTAPGEYVVRRGDTLSVIATRTGATIGQLRAANGIRGDMIRVGQKLVVPGFVDLDASAQVASASTAAPVEEVKTHRVRRGETLWRIANLYGTTVNMLRRENGLRGDILSVGQVLRVSRNGTNVASNR